MTTHTESSNNLPGRTAVGRSPAEVDDDLARYEAIRVQQLEELDPTAQDPVAVAHRESVIRILGEIRTARSRLAAGQFGLCARCGLTIAAARLEARPWTTHCIGCAEHLRY